MERQIPRPGERYVDERQRPYQVLCTAEYEKTGEQIVVCQMLYGEFACFARPLALFMGEEDKMQKDEVFSAGTPIEEQANPVLLRFLDADTLEQKYQLIKSLRGSITNRLIDDFAVTLDLVIPEGDVDFRYQQLLNGVRTMQKFETTRFRPK